jgi:glycosyltransferase involved in cell wall biosynthesis
VRLACISTILGYPWGSPDRLWTDLAARCLARGDDVFLGLSALTADHEAVRRLQRDGAELFIRAGNSVYRGWRDQLARRLPWRGREILETRLERFAPDAVVLTQGATYDSLAEHYLVDWLRRTGVPCVALCHNNPADATLTAEEAARVREFFALCAGTRFVSSHNLQLAEQRLGAPVPRAGLIQNPLAPGHPQPWPTLGDRPTLGLVGRLDIAHKGLDLLLPAVRSLPAPRPRLVFTGRCEDRPALTALLAASGFTSDDVDLRCPLPAEQVGHAYGELELFLLTSRYEGCASAMLEAMRAGRPVLATPVGGVSDWIVDGENGYVAADMTIPAITDALQRALTERARWPVLGAAAHATFAARRDPDPVATLLAVVDAAVPTAA